MTRDQDFPDYVEYDRRVVSLERRFGDLLQRLDSLRDRIRDAEEHIRQLSAETADWGPIISTARDQEYLRAWIEKQERKELAKRELRWTHIVALLSLAAVWTAGVAAIVGLVLRHSGNL